LITKAIKQTERALDGTRRAQEVARRAQELVKADLEGLWEIGEELEKLRAEQWQKARLRNITASIEKMQAATQRGFDELARANIETQKIMAETQEVLGEVGARIKRNEPPPHPGTGASLEEWFKWYHTLKDDMGRNRGRKGERITLGYIAERAGYSEGYVRQQHAGYMAEHGPLEES
jgi:hypothetical protein